MVAARRILLIAHALRPGSGWGTFASNAAAGLLAAGHEVTALVHTRSDHPCAQVAGLPAVLSPIASRLARARTAMTIVSAVRRCAPDLIHILVEPYALGLPLAGRFARLPPVVMNLHGSYTVHPFGEPGARRSLARVYRDSAAFLSCSEYTSTRVLEGVRKACGEDAERSVAARIYRFHFGIGSATFVSQTDNDVRRIMFAGEVKPRKGVLELIRACGELRRRSVIPFRLDIIGRLREGEEYVRLLRSTIAEEHLEGSVVLRGTVSDAELAEAYRAADAFAMLSKRGGSDFEGFGLVYLEAASRGIPVVSSLDSGGAEALKDGVTGYAVAHDDRGAVADALRRIFVGEIRRADCRAWADEHTIARQTKRFEEVYAEALRTSA